MQLWVVMCNIKADEKADQVFGVLQEESLNVFSILVLNTGQNHLVDVLKDSVNGLPLLIFLDNVIQRLKCDTS